MMEGWLCPRCKKINAPWVSQCTCTECHETITPNTPVTGDPPFTWPNNLNWVTCCDTAKKTPNTLYSSDKITSTTRVCNKTESLDGKMPN